MYRKKEKEPKELLNCEECNRCMFGKGEPKKCCSCYYMIIEDWDGWRKRCFRYDDWCDNIDVEECEDWRENKKVNV